MQNSKLQIVVILSTVLFGSNVAISADDNNSDKNKEGKVIILQKKETRGPQAPTDEPISDTIEATLIGDNLLINFDEYAGQCNVTVTNTLNGSSVQTSVSSAHPVVYNIGAIDTPVIITVETAASGTYEGIMMP